jgi:hypothetical protein
MNECDLVLMDNNVLTFVLLTQYFSVDQIEKNEIGGACGTNEGEKRCMQGFGGEI